jgi:hypothetical protein
MMRKERVKVTPQIRATSIRVVFKLILQGRIEVQFLSKIADRASIKLWSAPTVTKVLQLLSRVVCLLNSTNLVMQRC